MSHVGNSDYKHIKSIRYARSFMSFLRRVRRAEEERPFGFLRDVAELLLHAVTHRGVHRGGAGSNAGPELGTAGHCFGSRQCVSLVTMTRKQSVKAGTSSQPPRGRWRLQDAKARFSEVVRLAHSEGPQHVTLHGRDAVVVVDAEEFLRLKGKRTGQLLIDALQASPHRDIEIEPRRSAMSVRDVNL